LCGVQACDPVSLAEDLLDECPGERDIALYVAAPQQLLAQACASLRIPDCARVARAFSCPAARAP
jgi:hypothetical protein